MKILLFVCCMAWKYIGKNIQCNQIFQYHLLLSFHQFLNIHFFRIIYWIFGSFGSFANFISLLFSFSSKHQGKYIRISMNISDLIISIYFLSIAIIDESFRLKKQDNLIFLIKWLKSPLCRLFKNLIAYSLLNSSIFFFLFLFDIYLAVKNPLKKSILVRYTLVSTIIFNLISLSISFWEFLLYKVST